MLQMDGRSVWLDKNSVVTACSTLSRSRDDDLRRRRRSRSLKVGDRRRMDGALRPATQAAEPRPQTDVQKMKTLDVKPERKRPTVVRIQSPEGARRTQVGRGAGVIAGLQRSDSSPMIRHTPRQEGSVARRPKESSVRDALRRVNTVHPKDSMRRMKLILVPVETEEAGRLMKVGSTSGDSLGSTGKGEQPKGPAGKAAPAVKLKSSSAEVLSSSAESPLKSRQSTESLKSQQQQQQQQMQQPKKMQQQQQKPLQQSKLQQQQRHQQSQERKPQQQQQQPQEQQQQPKQQHQPEKQQRQQQKQQQQQKSQQQQQSQQSQKPPQQTQSPPISAGVSSADSSPRVETKGTKLVKRLSLRKKMTLPLSPAREKSSKPSPSPTAHERPVGAELVVPLGTPTDELLEDACEVSAPSSYNTQFAVTRTGLHRPGSIRAEPSRAEPSRAEPS